MASIKTGLALQHAISELGVLIKQKKALINKTDMPELDLPYLELKKIFHCALYTILRSHHDYLGCKINISTTRDLNEEQWLVVISTNVRSLDTATLAPLKPAIHNLGGNLEISTGLKGMHILFTLPYSKKKLT